MDRWLHGELTRQEAEALLTFHGAEEGMFLVRVKDATTEKYAISLSSNGLPRHFMIEWEGTQFYVNSAPFFSSTTLEEVIHNMVRASPMWKYPLRKFIPSDNTQQVEQLTPQQQLSSQHQAEPPEYRSPTLDSPQIPTLPTYANVPNLERYMNVPDPGRGEEQPPPVPPLPTGRLPRTTSEMSDESATQLSLEGSSEEKEEEGHSAERKKGSGIMSTLRMKSLTFLRRKKSTSCGVITFKVRYVGTISLESVRTEAVVIDEVAEKAVAAAKMVPSKPAQLFSSLDGFTIMSTDKEREILCQLNFSRVFGAGIASEHKNVVVILYFPSQGDAAARAVVVEGKESDSIFATLEGGIQAAHNYNAMEAGANVTFIQFGSGHTQDMDLSSLQAALQ
eukprot:m.101840 g.101840  ORF g.101840 m.101840 type:complete len:392 (-) comp14990_c0_seq1:1565-2740(-)